jgi:threonine synthase
VSLFLKECFFARKNLLEYPQIILNTPLKNEKTMSKKYEIVCVNCQKKFTEDQTITRCLECGQALDIQFDIAKLQETINPYTLKNTPISAMKYLNFYPLNNRSSVVSLNEGATPLVESKELGEKYKVANLYIKNEGANPTGVFKDRGTLVEISKALELGAKGIVVASTGNMAASVSAYAAKAKIPCYVLVPEGTPSGKLSQSLTHGGKVLKIRGTYADCIQLSEKMAKQYDFLLAGDYAFRSEGQKSIAFEIIEQLNWKVPDVVIAPIGCGTNLYGIAKGFFEWKELGLIDKVPRIIGVQPEGADTMYSAFYAGEKKARKIARPTSLCSAVNIGAPLDDMKIMKIIKESNGGFEIIDDNTVLQAQKDMSMMSSVFTEPSGAIPVACLPKLLAEKKISSDETVVCIATGIGLKDPHSASLLFPNLPALDANMSEISAFLDSGLSNIQSKRDDQHILFTFKPTSEELKKISQEEFSFSAEKNPHIFEQLQQEIGYFFERRNEMRKSEFQVILEEVLADFRFEGQNILKIKDFSVQNSLTQKSQAQVQIEFEGTEFSGESDGTGPVDATISAIEKILKKHTDFHITLINYSVQVASGGVDASVRVEMEFSDQKGNTVRVFGVSSDIVVASIMAYKKGFSRLYAKGK